MAGAHKPLVRPSAILCPEIHGDTGLDGPMGGPLLPHSAQQPLQGKAVNVMFEAIEVAYDAGGGQRVRCVPQCSPTARPASNFLVLAEER